MKRPQEGSSVLVFDPFEDEWVPGVVTLLLSAQFTVDVGNSRQMWAKYNSYGISWKEDKNGTVYPSGMP